MRPLACAILVSVVTFGASLYVPAAKALTLTRTEPLGCAIFATVTIAKMREREIGATGTLKHAAEEEEEEGNEEEEAEDED